MAPLMKSTTSLLSCLFLLGVLCASCASLDDRMAAYVGQPRSELVNNWGPPHEETKLKKGRNQDDLLRTESPPLHPQPNY